MLGEEEAGALRDMGWECKLYSWAELAAARNIACLSCLSAVQNLL